MVSLLNCVQCLLSCSCVIIFKRFELPFFNALEYLADLEGLSDEDNVDKLIDYIWSDEVRSVAEFLDVIS
jgi:hypothetical protein